jgi:hypothetical protein
LQPEGGSERGVRRERTVRSKRAREGHTAGTTLRAGISTSAGGRWCADTRRAAGVVFSQPPVPPARAEDVAEEEGGMDSEWAELPDELFEKVL